MTMSIIHSDRQLNELRESITRCHSLEAKTKALRMQLQTLADDRERNLLISVDQVMAHVASEPDFDDLWEIDTARFGEDLTLRVFGGEL